MREAYDRYSNISILLHWLIAGLLVTNVIVAIAMHSDPATFSCRCTGAGVLPPMPAPGCSRARA